MSSLDWTTYVVALVAVACTGALFYLAWDFGRLWEKNKALDRWGEINSQAEKNIPGRHSLYWLGAMLAAQYTASGRKFDDLSEYTERVPPNPTQGDQVKGEML